MKTVIIIPCFNNEDTIDRVIGQLHEAGYSCIVVVDDGSSDRSAQIARARGAVVLSHVVNRGQGAALETGNTYALAHGADIVVHFDADGQMQAADIKNMVQPIADGDVDVTLGSRFLGNATSLPWLKRFVIFPVARPLNFFFSGIYLSDVHNGFRALSRRAAEQLRITQDRMAHNTEISQKIRSLRLPYREVPVTIVYHRFGQGIAGGLRILRDLLMEKIVR